MSAGLFLRGLILGFSIAAPVGPIGVLCIRRTLADGRRAGFVSGLGAAVADSLYGAVAAFGLTALTSALVAEQRWIRLAGGAFMIVLGVRTLLSPPAAQAAAGRAGTLLAAFGSTFVLTVTNPMTILSFAAVFAGLGLGSATGGLAGAAAMVLGVFIGSAAWWLLLSVLVGAFRTRLGARELRWVNWISGGIIAGFGVAAFASVALRGATH